MVKTELVLDEDMEKAEKLFRKLNSIMVDYSDYIRLYKNNPTHYHLFNDRMLESDIKSYFAEAFNDAIIEYVNGSSEAEQKESSEEDEWI